MYDMAKSKLSVELSKALLDVFADLLRLKTIVDQQKKPSEQDYAAFFEKFEALKSADIKISNHLHDLKKREQNPSVANKLRNLKNVFKDKQDLEAQRARSAEWYERAETAIGQIWDAVKEMKNEGHRKR